MRIIQQGGVMSIELSYQDQGQGDIIGYIGATGLSTGPHLRYKITHNGKRSIPYG